MKTLVIGLDAATWRVITPLIEQGKLPNIQALIKEGTSGTLRSTIPPMTPLAWTSIATGVNPGKHGIYGFAAQDRKTYKVAPVNFSGLKKPAIWDIFNAYDKKVGVVNFPVAFPPPRVESFFISGFASPESENYAYPPVLNGYLKSKGYRIYPCFGPNDGTRRYFGEVKELTETQCELTIELMKRWDWELFWVVFQGLDWIQHYLWNVIINGENAVKAFYQYMDSIVGRLLQEACDDWNIVILSDHGFREIRAEIYLNNLLEEWGYLKRVDPSKTFTARVRDSILKAGWALGRKFPFGVKQLFKQCITEAIHLDLRELQTEQLRFHQMIDWSQTQAFSFDSMGRIYIHKEGKYPQGIVPVKEYELFREKLIKQLRSLKDPKTKKPIVGDIFRKEEIYSGDQLEDAPDISFTPSDFAYMFHGGFGDSWFRRPQDRVADHDMEGIFIMKGKNIRRDTKTKSETVDIVPTLLYLHDLPILKDMDGRILKDALTEHLAKKRRVRTVRDISYRAVIKHQPGQREQKEIVRRLKDLGYL